MLFWKAFSISAVIGKQELDSIKEEGKLLNSSNFLKGPIKSDGEGGKATLTLDYESTVLNFESDYTSDNLCLVLLNGMMKFFQPTIWHPTLPEKIEITAVPPSKGNYTMYLASETVAVVKKNGETVKDELFPHTFSLKFQTYFTDVKFPMACSVEGTYVYCPPKP